MEGKMEIGGKKELSGLRRGKLGRGTEETVQADPEATELKR